MSRLAWLNALPGPRARRELLRCCGSRAWAAEMAGRRPFRSRRALLTAASAAWRGLGRQDWLEAFAAHPKIGGKAALRKRFSSTKEWAAGEQSGVAGAEETLLEGLAAGNRLYERKFGYIFIVCATGKTAAQMLGLLRARLPNDPRQELSLAAAEQAKITRLRLEKLLKA